MKWSINKVPLCFVLDWRRTMMDVKFTVLSTVQSSYKFRTSLNFKAKTFCSLYPLAW